MRDQLDSLLRDQSANKARRGGEVRLRCPQAAGKTHQ
jgi:hypothetical protein